MSMIPIDNHISESLDHKGVPKRYVNFSNWTYVDLHDLDNDPRSYGVKVRLMNSYMIWLEEHLGSRGETWEYRSGDRYAQGIYFKEAQVALMFKLSFIV